MGVSQAGAPGRGRHADGAGGDANDASEPFAVAVVGGDDVFAARIHAALRREGMAVHVRWQGAHAHSPAWAPEVVVLALPSGDAPQPAVAAVRQRLPRARVVVALPEGAAGRAEALVTGDGAADGVVADTDLDRTLPLVVRCARAGYVAVPASVAVPAAAGEPAKPAFSRRERQVVRLVVLGLTNEEIAQRLFLAKSTVAGHLTAVFRRLGVRSRRELVAAVLAGDDGLRRTFLAVALPGDDDPGPEPAA